MAIMRTAHDRAGVTGLVFKKMVKEEDPNIAGAPGVYQANLSVSLTPASVGATTCAEQTFAVGVEAAFADLDAGDFISVTPPSITAGVAPVCARSSGGNLIITFCNPTAGALTPAAGVYQIHVIRVE